MQRNDKYFFSGYKPNNFFGNGNMLLTAEEKEMLEGAQGRATQKAMQILVALGEIYGAERMIPVTSAQIAGVSYDNLGEAGLQFLSEMAEGGGKARVLTTLNPAGMDIENWRSLGIQPDFAEKQERVLDAYSRMGVISTCTCTPYLTGNLPLFGEHIAWSESSAVCYANSVLGARTNREGGPSALASSLTGRTPEYGFHLENTSSLLKPSPTSEGSRRQPWRTSNLSAPAWQPTVVLHFSIWKASPPKQPPSNLQ
jgi:predicted aconitase